MNDKELSLTPLEFDILWYLCEHNGNVVSSEELFEAVWKEKYIERKSEAICVITNAGYKVVEWWKIHIAEEH